MSGFGDCTPRDRKGDISAERVRYVQDECCVIPNSTRLSIWSLLLKTRRINLVQELKLDHIFQSLSRHVVCCIVRQPDRAAGDEKRHCICKSLSDMVIVSKIDAPRSMPRTGSRPHHMQFIHKSSTSLSSTSCIAALCLFSSSISL